MSDEQRKRLEVAVGTMMRYALEQYTSGERKLSAVRESGGNPQAVEMRNDTERLILTGEQLLAALVPPPLPTPAVSDGMRKADTTDMKNAWRKWVGVLQKTVGRDFSLVEQPESAPAPAEGTKGGDEGGE
jgi:hypothetical protein